MSSFCVISVICCARF